MISGLSAQDMNRVTNNAIIGLSSLSMLNSGLQTKADVVKHPDPTTFYFIIKRKITSNQFC